MSKKHFSTLHWSINPKPLDHEIYSSQKIQRCVLLIVSFNSDYVTWVVLEISLFQKSCSAWAHTKIPKNHLFHAYLVNNSKSNRPWNFFFWGSTEVHPVVIHCEQRVCNLGSFRDIGSSKSLLSSSSDNPAHNILARPPNFQEMWISENILVSKRPPPPRVNVEWLGVVRLSVSSHQTNIDTWGEGNESI